MVRSLSRVGLGLGLGRFGRRTWRLRWKHVLLPQSVEVVTQVEGDRNERWDGTLSGGRVAMELDAVGKDAPDIQSDGTSVLVLPTSDGAADLGQVYWMLHDLAVNRNKLGMQRRYWSTELGQKRDAAELSHQSLEIVVILACDGWDGIVKAGDGTLESRAGTTASCGRFALGRCSRRTLLRRSATLALRGTTTGSSGSRLGLGLGFRFGRCRGCIIGLLRGLLRFESSSNCGLLRGLLRFESSSNCGLGCRQ